MNCIKCPQVNDLEEQITYLKQLLSKSNPFSTTGRCKICKCDRMFSHEDNCGYVENIEEEDNNG